jgi:hypothetical protein
VDVAGHDADFDFIGGDQAGAVGAEQQGLFAACCFLGAHFVAHFEHVFDRNAFGNANGQVQVGFDRFPNGGGRAGRRHINHRNRGTGGARGFF